MLTRFGLEQRFAADAEQLRCFKDRVKEWAASAGGMDVSATGVVVYASDTTSAIGIISKWRLAGAQQKRGTGEAYPFVQCLEELKSAGFVDFRIAADENGVPKAFCIVTPEGMENLVHFGHVVGADPAVSTNISGYPCTSSLPRVCS
jgi:hypothetical protein